MGNFSIWSDIETLSNQQLQQQYNIEINEDQTVWDCTEMKQFDNIQHWGQYMAEFQQQYLHDDNNQFAVDHRTKKQLKKFKLKSDEW